MTGPWLFILFTFSQIHCSFKIFHQSMRSVLASDSNAINRLACSTVSILKKTDVVARKSTPNSSYSSVEPNSSSLHYHHSQSHERDSNSSWPSSHSMLENEDSIFSPHVTLSTVFENTHSDFDEDSQHHYGQGENPTLRGSCQSSKDSLQDEHQLPIHPHQQHHSVTSNTHPSSSNKKVKFVEKQSLEQALRMLDRAI